MKKWEKRKRGKKIFLKKGKKEKGKKEKLGRRKTSIGDPQLGIPN